MSFRSIIHPITSHPNYGDFVQLTIELIEHYESFNDPDYHKFVRSLSTKLGPLNELERKVIVDIFYERGMKKLCERK